MPAAEVKSLITELLEALKALEVPMLGIEKMLCPDPGSEVSTALRNEQGELAQRKSLLQSAIGALEMLLTDGYPDVPKPVVSPAVVDQLSEESRVIAATLPYFPGPPSPEPATKATFVTAQPVRKEKSNG